MTYASDFKINFDLGWDKAIRCHQNVDFQISHTGDIALTSTDSDYILQKIFLWMSIKYGEIPGEPDLGCCVYKYFYKKATPNTFALLEREVATELRRLIPELGVTSVKAVSATNDSGRIDSVELEIITARHGTIQASVDQDEYTSIWDALMLDFQYPQNSQYLPTVF